MNDPKKPDADAYYPPSLEDALLDGDSAFAECTDSRLSRDGGAYFPSFENDAIGLIVTRNAAPPPASPVPPRPRGNGGEAD